MGLARQPKLVIKRIEAAPPAHAEVVTARALAPLSQLLEWSDRHRMDTAICLFHKGKDWQAEVDEAKKTWDFSPEAFASVTDRDAVLLRIGPYTAADLRDRQPEGRRR
jgi:16S rRNA (guanine527-N7)-methyltransferase